MTWAELAAYAMLITSYLSYRHESAIDPVISERGVNVYPKMCNYFRPLHWDLVIKSIDGTQVCTLQHSHNKASTKEEGQHTVLKMYSNGMSEA